MISTDVVIIGAGPAGLFAIFECGMLRLGCHVIDALDSIGGQCTALYAEKPIYDIPAYPQITGAELIRQLDQQIRPFNPTFHLGQSVTHIEQLDTEGRSWKIKTSTGTEIQGKSIIIAAGVGAFGPNRPPLDGIEDYEGTSVHYYVKNRDLYRDKKVVIAGGGDSAVDWAISLAEIAKKVSIVHRRPKFRAAPESEKRLNELANGDVIDLVTPFQLEALKGDGQRLQEVVIKSLDHEIKSIEADYLLPFFGLSMNLGPITEWGLGLDKNHIQVDPVTAATNRPGIYAIGDVATYPHKLKLILTGFAEGARAAHSSRSFIYPDEVLHFEYSTTHGVPKPEEKAA
jgi:thioredoxin reductase (NADPH)